MNKHVVRGTLLVAFSSVACSNGTIAPGPSSSVDAPARGTSAPSLVAPESGGRAPGGENDGARVPLVLRVSGPPSGSLGTVVEVTATIERHNESTAPIDVTVALPAGAKLVSGSATEHIETMGPGILTRNWKIRIDGAPSDDFVVNVTSGASGWGVHAQQAYRFGRPEPKLPEPKRAEPMKGAAGKSLGQPILLDPPKRR